MAQVVLLIALFCSTWNVAMLPWVAWRHGCRLNEAARNRDGRAARFSLLILLVSAWCFACSVQIIFLILTHGGL